jgi:hypothetical protein
LAEAAKTAELEPQKTKTSQSDHGGTGGLEVVKVQKATWEPAYPARLVKLFVYCGKVASRFDVFANDPKTATSNAV